MSQTSMERWVYKGANKKLAKTCKKQEWGIEQMGESEDPLLTVELIIMIQIIKKSFHTCSLH